MSTNHLGIAVAIVCSFLALNRAALADVLDATTGPATQPAPVVSENIAANSPGQLWNFHLQNTDVVQGYPGFPARYSGPNSLPSGGETRETISLDVLAGVHLWRGAEAHVDGLMFQGLGIGDTVGAEGFPNGEAYRMGAATPNGTLARLFIRQTIGFGGEQDDVSDTALTLAAKQDISRLTITLGRLASTDIFDTSTYANSARTQFMNWGLANNLAWDYPAGVTGYTTGITLELNQPKWTLRYGFFQVPGSPNSTTSEDRFFTWPTPALAQDGQFLRSWAMVTELERRYTVNDHPGTIRLLAFLNSADMARYSSATSILQANGVGADISAAQGYRYKYGVGLNWEQEVTKNVGLFSRLGWNDGQEQGWMFSDVAYTASLGASVKGEAWHRPDDTFGLAGLLNGASHKEQEFFNAGGLGILAGDGNLNYGWEKVMETYYDFSVWKSVHAALDYQFISDPAFNRDRGPVSVLGARLHWEL